MATPVTFFFPSGSLTIWLNTDLNAATGYQIFGSGGGAEYNVEINADGTATLYQDSAGQTAPTLVLGRVDGFNQH